jgi:hypothetical protein
MGASGEMMPLECDIEETGSASAFMGMVSSVGTMGTASMASLSKTVLRTLSSYRSILRAGHRREP